MSKLFMQTEFQIRDEKGTIFNTVTEPAVVFDKACGTVLKIGQYENMDAYFSMMYTKYSTMGFQDEANDLALLALPKDQEIIDKVFQNTGFILRYLENNKI